MLRWGYFFHFFSEGLVLEIRLDVPLDSGVDSLDPAEIFDLYGLVGRNELSRGFDVWADFEVEVWQESLPLLHRVFVEIQSLNSLPD